MWIWCMWIRWIRIRNNIGRNSRCLPDGAPEVDHPAGGAGMKGGPRPPQQLFWNRTHVCLCVCPTHLLAYGILEPAQLTKHFLTFHRQVCGRGGGGEGLEQNNHTAAGVSDYDICCLLGARGRVGGGGGYKCSSFSAVHTITVDWSRCNADISSFQQGTSSSLPFCWRQKSTYKLRSQLSEAEQFLELRYFRCCHTSGCILRHLLRERKF